MAILRRHVRLWVMAWFLLQAASLSALVPRDCCVSHRPVVAVPSCHEADHEAPPASSHDCVMRGTCQGPPLFTVFSSAGLPAATSTSWPQASPTPRAANLAERTLARVQPPDLPPPRS
jgi:hypothetical protein